jgi:hypothetical protein
MIPLIQTGCQAFSASDGRAGTGKNPLEKQKMQIDFFGFRRYD